MPGYQIDGEENMALFKKNIHIDSIKIKTPIIGVGMTISEEAALAPSCIFETIQGNILTLKGFPLWSFPPTNFSSLGREVSTAMPILPQVMACLRSFISWALVSREMQK